MCYNFQSILIIQVSLFTFLYRWLIRFIACLKVIFFYQLGKEGEKSDHVILFLVKFRDYLNYPLLCTLFSWCLCIHKCSAEPLNHRIIHIYVLGRVLVKQNFSNCKIYLQFINNSCCMWSSCQIYTLFTALLRALTLNYKGKEKLAPVLNLPARNFDICPGF